MCPSVLCDSSWWCSCATYDCMWNIFNDIHVCRCVCLYVVSVSGYHAPSTHRATELVVNKVKMAHMKYGCKNMELFCLHIYFRHILYDFDYNWILQYIFVCSWHFRIPFLSKVLLLADCLSFVIDCLPIPATENYWKCIKKR